MPGACLHRELAYRLREHKRFQQFAGFPYDDPQVWRSFLAGSVGPDMGVFPGGVSLISDLAHYERSGDLCREIVAHAQTDNERAYAWGWVSHVIADQIFHPLINCGVGAYLQSDRKLEIAYAANPAAHVQVELGLDAHWIAFAPRSGLFAIGERTFEPESKELLAVSRAFQNLYGLDLDRELAQSHRAIGSWIWSWFQLARLNSRRIGWNSSNSCNLGVSEIVLFPGWILTLLAPVAAPVRGFFRAVYPEEWFVAECHRRMELFEIEYLRHLESGTPHLVNYNLDTGEIDDADDPYLPATMTRETLSKLLNVSQS